jgi:hypothetical protein
MPESTNIKFSFHEIVTAMLKAADIHDGIWGLFVRFGLGASNVGESETTLRPAAIVPIVEIGLQKFEKESSIAVDAAKVNPQLSIPKIAAEGRTH